MPIATYRTASAVARTFGLSQHRPRRWRGQGPASLVVRWKRSARMDYAAAQARYAPFERPVDEDPSTRESIARLVAAPLAVGEPVFVIANNRAEVSARLAQEQLAISISTVSAIDR